MGKETVYTFHLDIWIEFPYVFDHSFMRMEADTESEKKKERINLEAWECSSVCCDFKCMRSMDGVSEYKHLN